MQPLQSCIKSYSNGLPVKVVDSIIKNGITSFIATVLWTGNSQVGLFMAGTAAAATLVSALSLPIFSRLVQNDGKLDFLHQVAIQMISLASTQLLINSLTSYRLYLTTTSYVATIFINVLWNECTDLPARTNPIYILIGV